MHSSHILAEPLASRICPPVSYNERSVSAPLFWVLGSLRFEFCVPFQGVLKDFARPLLENAPERGPGSPQPEAVPSAFAPGETGCISLALNLIKKLQGFRVQQHFNVDAIAGLPNGFRSGALIRAPSHQRSRNIWTWHTQKTSAS
jgi:hypothetical protein